MTSILRTHHGMNIVGQGGKIILFTLPPLAAAVGLDVYFPQAAALPQSLAFLQPLGWVLLVPGLALWGSAVFQLMVAFSQGRLATSGAYGIVRNPIYASAIYFLLPAAALLSQAWVYLVVSLFLFAGVMIFIGPEEQQMRAAFGKAYEDYLKRVDRLVPFKKP
jgi:protein-S-isoprenylcysteine O-methyltransferase Ste14